LVSDTASEFGVGHQLSFENKRLTRFSSISALVGRAKLSRAEIPESATPISLGVASRLAWIHLSLGRFDQRPEETS
jgi:hypothetical protein